MDTINRVIVDKVEQIQCVELITEALFKSLIKSLYVIDM